MQDEAQPSAATITEMAEQPPPADPAVAVADDAPPPAAPARERRPEPSATIAQQFEEMEAWLSSLGTPRDEYNIEVNRLVNFEKDQRADAAAKQKYCGLVDAGPQIKEDIKQRYGGGYYLLFVKQKGKIRKIYFVAIDGAPVQPNPAPSAAVAVVAPPSPVDALQQLMPLLGMIKELQAMFTPPAPPAPVAAPATITTEGALLKLISEDSESLGAVTDRLLGRGRESGGRSLAEVFAPLIESTAPYLAPLLANIAVRLAQPPGQAPMLVNPPVPSPLGPPPGAAVPPSAPFTPQTAPTAPAAAAPLQPEVMEEEEEGDLVEMPHLDLLDNLVAILRAGLPIEPAVDMVAEFRAKFPAYATTLDGLLSMEPAALLSMLPLLNPQHADVAQLENAADWLLALQTRLGEQQQPQA